MPMDRIDNFRAFVAVVERGSLTGAAQQVGRSLQSVSRSLAAVEHEVGIELVRRTTRRSSPTETGLAFYRRLRGALDEIEAAKTEASNRRSEPSGLLRLTAAPAFAPFYLMPAMAAFLEKHPQVRVDLELSDRYVDLVAEGFDLAIRVGEMPDSTLKGRRLADLRRVIFASPAYFAKHGRPRRAPPMYRAHRRARRRGLAVSRRWAP
jgi:DNA-binding transcriptional LysR family regulator